MLGLFGVSMPVVYGEGHEKALRRLRREIDDIPISMMMDHG
jgi:ribosomal protein S21